MIRSVTRNVSLAYEILMAQVVQVLGGSVSTIHPTSPIPTRLGMRHGGVLVAIASCVAACEPPPAPDLSSAGGGEPSVEILYPPRDVGGIALVREGDDCFLDMLVVADVRDFTYVSPTEQKEDVEGEGHFHFNVNGVYKDAPPDRQFEWRSEANEFTAGRGVQISVTLASNTHRDLDAFSGWIDVIEFVTEEPPEGGCGGEGGSGDTGDTDDGLLPVSGGVGYP